MQTRDIVLSLGCLALTAGIGLMSGSVDIAGYGGLVSLSGWALIVGGGATGLAAIISAALEKPPGNP